MAPLQVSSYGTNGHVKLPGTSQREPNVYDFGTPYADIYEDLRQKDENFYSRKGLLQVQTCLGTPSAMLPICLAHQPFCIARWKSSSNFVIMFKGCAHRVAIAWRNIVGDG